MTGLLSRNRRIVGVSGLCLVGFVTMVRAEDAAAGAADTASILVKYDIAGAEADGKIYVNHVGGRGEIGTESLGPMKWSPLKNGETLELKDLPAGDYQVARYRQVEIGEVGMSRVHQGVYLDRRTLKLKSGEKVAVEFTRPKGQSVRGRVVGLKEVKLDRAVVCICSENVKNRDALGKLDVTIFDVTSCDKDGTFVTEGLSAGKYSIVAQGYEPWTEDDLKFTGKRLPRYIGIGKLDVPETGEVRGAEVELQDTQTTTGGKAQRGDPARVIVRLPKIEPKTDADSEKPKQDNGADEPQPTIAKLPGDVTVELIGETFCRISSSMSLEESQ